MRMGKADLVTLYEARCKEGLAMEAAARGKREKISALEEAVARLRVWRTRRELAAVIDRLVQRGIVAKADAAGAKSKLMESNG
jgi:ribosomal protein S20